MLEFLKTPLGIIIAVLATLILVAIICVAFLLITAKPCHSNDTIYRGCGKILFIMDKRIKIANGEYLCEDCVKRELEVAGLISISKNKDTDEQPLPNNYTNSARS